MSYDDRRWSMSLRSDDRQPFHLDQLPWYNLMPVCRIPDLRNRFHSIIDVEASESHGLQDIHLFLVLTLLYLMESTLLHIRIHPRYVLQVNNSFLFLIMWSHHLSPSHLLHRSLPLASLWYPYGLCSQMLWSQMESYQPAVWHHLQTGLGFHKLWQLIKYQLLDHLYVLKLQWSFLLDFFWHLHNLWSLPSL